MVIYKTNLVPNMESAANGALQELRKQQTGSLSYEEGFCEFGPQIGYCLSGTFKRQGKVLAFEHKILTHKNYLWQINIVYTSGDLAEKTLANNILTSANVGLH